MSLIDDLNIPHAVEEAKTLVGSIFGGGTPTGTPTPTPTSTGDVPVSPTTSTAKKAGITTGTVVAILVGLFVWNKLKSKRE